MTAVVCDTDSCAISHNIPFYHAVNWSAGRQVNCLYGSNSAS